MSRSEPQLNIRSAYVRERVGHLSRQTGLTATRVVEEAVRAWRPDGPIKREPRLVAEGPLLVVDDDGPVVTIRQLQDAIDGVREDRADAVAFPLG